MVLDLYSSTSTVLEYSNTECYTSGLIDCTPNLKRFLQCKIKAGWWSGNALVSGAEGRRLKSQTGQIRHIVANGSPPCDTSSKGAVLPATTMTRI